MSNLWTIQEEQLLKKLVSASKSLDETYKAFTIMRGLEGFDVTRTERSISDKAKKLGLQPDPLTDLERNLNAMKVTYDKFKEESMELYSPVSSTDRFILSLSDIHFPFSNPDRLVSILEQWKVELSNPNSIIVLNGDILDEYAASMFSKYKEIHLVHEYRMAFKLVQICLNYVGNVALTKGNHEARLQRMVSEHIPTTVSGMLQTDLLARIANGEELDERGTLIDIHKDMQARVRYQFKEPWYCRIGKTLFVHPSGYGSSEQPGSTVAKVNRLMDSRYTRDDYDSVVCGHTHSQSKQIMNGRMLIEQGALCGLLGYEGKADLKFTHFSTNGYAVIYQDKDGNTNFNESRTIYLGQCLPKKKFITWNKSFGS